MANRGVRGGDREGSEGGGRRSACPTSPPLALPPPQGDLVNAKLFCRPGTWTDDTVPPGPSALDAPSRPPPKGPNSSSVDLEGGRSSLCLWILVADRVSEPDEHLLFAYQWTPRPVT